MELADLFDAVKQRECILFLGAGVHYPPPEDLPEYQYPVEERPPLGAQLSHKLARECVHRMLASSRSDPLDHKNDKEQRDDRAKDLRDKHAYLIEHRDELQRISWFYELNHQRQQLIDRVSEAVGDKKKAVGRGESTG